jgi:hypothetical protein
MQNLYHNIYDLYIYKQDYLFCFDFKGTLL